MTQSHQPFSDPAYRLFLKRAAGITSALSPEQKFVHYTSAEAADLIIGTKDRPSSLLLRAAPVMNDFTEIHYGFEMLRFATEDAHSVLFKEVAEAIMPVQADDVLREVQHWGRTAISRVFMASVSLHNPDENDIGRLSMWRAYGGSTAGVAIVLNNEPFLAPGPIDNFWSSPVFYADKDMFSREFHDTFEGIRVNLPMLLSKYPRHQLQNILMLVLKAAMLCTKHRGFHEEKEWRIIYAQPDQSAFLSEEVITIGGIPQVVQRLMLKDYGSGFDLSPAKLIDRVIIGPTQYPMMVENALRQCLVDQGVAEPRIVFSNIPLRT